MSYFTIRSRRASPNGQHWEEDPTRFPYRGDAFLALVRRLDREYPDQWELNCGFQFVLKEAHGGSLSLGYIDEHLSEREELARCIAEMDAELTIARAKLAALEREREEREP